MRLLGCGWADRLSRNLDFLSLLQLDMAKYLSPVEGALLPQGPRIGLQAPYADPLSGTGTVDNRGPMPPWNAGTFKQRGPGSEWVGPAGLLAPSLRDWHTGEETASGPGPPHYSRQPSLSSTEASLGQAGSAVVPEATQSRPRQRVWPCVTLQEMGHTPTCAACRRSCPAPRQALVTVDCLVLSLSTATTPSFNKTH